MQWRARALVAQHSITARGALAARLRARRWWGWGPRMRPERPRRPHYRNKIHTICQIVWVDLKVCQIVAQIVWKISKLFDTFSNSLAYRTIVWQIVLVNKIFCQTKSVWQAVWQTKKLFGKQFAIQKVFAQTVWLFHTIWQTLRSTHTIWQIVWTFFR